MNVAVTHGVISLLFYFLQHVHRDVTMDRIVGHQELRSPTAGPERLNSDILGNHRVTHFSSPYENQELINRPSSRGSANSHLNLDGFAVNSDCERLSSPWHYAAYWESNKSGCDNINTEPIGWSVRPGLLGMAASQRSTTGSIRGSTDHDVGYHSVDQSPEFPYSEPNKIKLNVCRH